MAHGCTQDMGADETREVVEEVGLCAKVMDHMSLVLRTISWEGMIGFGF